MTHEGLTAAFRWPAVEPLHGSLELLFDLMETVAVLGASPAMDPPRRPIEGTFLL